jgi:hypothetical protein
VERGHDPPLERLQREADQAREGRKASRDGRRFPARLQGNLGCLSIIGDHPHQGK